MNLHPTPTRLALLAEMGDDDEYGCVWEEWHTGEPGTVWHRASPGRKFRVTDKVREMKAAGWCRTRPADDGLDMRDIELTDAGRALLAKEG